MAGGSTSVLLALQLTHRGSSIHRLQITSASIVADISAGGRGLKRIPTPAKGHADFFLTEAGGFLIKSIKPGELKLLANVCSAAVSPANVHDLCTYLLPTPMAIFYTWDLCCD
eukprot:SAG31_NODE_604_length_13629_cov_11.035994_2_plen_113_part_00